MCCSFIPFGLRILYLDIFKCKYEIGHNSWMHSGIFVILFLLLYFQWYNWFYIRECSKLCLPLSLVNQSKHKISQVERKDGVVGDFVVLDFVPRVHDFCYATRVVNKRRRNNAQADMADKWHGYLPLCCRRELFLHPPHFWVVVVAASNTQYAKIQPVDSGEKKRGCDRITPIKQMVEKCF